MTDRRRVNPPQGGTTAPVFASQLAAAAARTAAGGESADAPQRPTRTRQAGELRKIFLQTGLVPTAPGSSYLELPPPTRTRTSFTPPSSSLKLTCTVHGPRPLPRSAPFSSQLVLSTNVKFAPFATRTRRGYLRDSVERDLAVHLETALRGVVIGERWPKSGCDVIITVLEAEEGGWWGDEVSGKQVAGGGQWGVMNVLAGCITAASAALVDAGIDCVDLVTGGVAAVVGEKENAENIVLDPCPSEHASLVAGCVVGYIQQRDEVTAIWMKGDAGQQPAKLIDSAVQAAIMSRTVLTEALKASLQARVDVEQEQENATANGDAQIPNKTRMVEMTG